MTWWVVAVVALGLYAIECVVWPYRRCHWCSGSGRWRSPITRSYRDCGRCGGDGQMVRWGRRAYEAVRPPW
ncbi:hypothetical protein [Pseudonocardia asaccharolytica]|uniref:hypothetical protein n=1 Tax=Pseudonocardia asaccharolytica TaxID=54010 RepID=UPI00041A127D|nr:hypothetical protein [Pseudonocardia asaccharolytica]